MLERVDMGQRSCFLSVRDPAQHMVVDFTGYMRPLGGWSGSHWYSQAMSTESNRSKLVKTLAKTVESYGLDGRRQFNMLSVNGGSPTLLKALTSTG